MVAATHVTAMQSVLYAIAAFALLLAYLLSLLSVLIMARKIGRILSKRLPLGRVQGWFHAKVHRRILAFGAIAVAVGIALGPILHVARGASILVEVLGLGVMALLYHLVCVPSPRASEPAVSIENSRTIARTIKSAFVVDTVLFVLYYLISFCYSHRISGLVVSALFLVIVAGTPTYWIVSLISDKSYPEDA